MTREDVIALWRLADAEGRGPGKSWDPDAFSEAQSSRGLPSQGSGRVDLGQVVSVLRRAQLEAWEHAKFVAQPAAPASQGLTQGRPLPQPPASPADRDMILEASRFLLL